MDNTALLKFYEDLCKHNTNQYIFVYNELKQGLKYHSILKGSKCHGTFLTREGDYTMLTISDPLPVIRKGGDNYVVGEVYNVKASVFKVLIGFNHGLIPHKRRVSGFKKRVWVWEVPPESKFMFKTLDKPSNKVYNWGDTSNAYQAPENVVTFLPRVVETPIIEMETGIMAAEVPTNYTPIKTSTDGKHKVNADTLVYNLLSHIDTLDDAIWDSKMPNSKRGDICRESIEELRKLSMGAVKVFG